jgi:hypothetical protein
LRIRLTSWPKPGELDEFDFRQYRLGEVYDLPLNFASVLLISGCAEIAPAAPERRGSAADRGRTPSRRFEPEF